MGKEILMVGWDWMRDLVQSEQRRSLLLHGPFVCCRDGWASARSSHVHTARDEFNVCKYFGTLLESFMLNLHFGRYHSLVARLVSFDIVSVSIMREVKVLVFAMVVRLLTQRNHRECNPVTIRCFLCLMKPFDHQSLCRSTQSLFSQDQASAHLFSPKMGLHPSPPSKVAACSDKSKHPSSKS